jgi:hypothetical protein
MRVLEEMGVKLISLDHFWSWYSLVSIATGYGLNNRGVGILVPVGSRIFSTSPRPALGPTQPPILWIAEDLSPGLKRPGRELILHLQLVPRSRKCGSIYIHSPIRLHGVVLNYLNTGTTLLFVFISTALSREFE